MFLFLAILGTFIQYPLSVFIMNNFTFRFGLKCVKETKDKDLYYPAYEPKTNKCILQERPLLFSCEGGHKDLQRICPCRDFIKHQIALCKDC